MGEHILKYRVPIFFVLLGIFISGIGILATSFYTIFSDESRIEVISHQEDKQDEVVVEVAGEVASPGVYSFEVNSRIRDVLDKAGGLLDTADNIWVEKNLNLASKLTDGQKIYIPSRKDTKQSSADNANHSTVYQSTSSTFEGYKQNLTNINTASLSELDKLPGIGPVYGQSIIESRPYSNVEDLSSKGVLNNSTYDKIKDLVSVF